MTCKHCCGANDFFDLKGAEKKLRQYKKKGPDKVTSRLIEFFRAEYDFHDKSLLDIGGGVGAIQWEFLRKGGKATINVDASNGYQVVAKDYAYELGFAEKVNFVFGDFVEKSSEVMETDFVTMDKVLCCYPDYQSLLENAIKKCRKSIMISYPLGGFLAKFYAKVENLYFAFKKNPFRTYIHSPQKIEGFIANHGFEITKKSISFPWHVQLYKKTG